MADCIWPQRTRPLRQLTEAQYAAWERDGFVVLPGLIPSDLCANAAAVIRKYIGADDARPETWYTNTQDIYDATLSPRPAHGPCGMVQLYHHATLWALRQHPAIHACSDPDHASWPNSTVRATQQPLRPRRPRSRQP